jgi:hypothetical protein
MTELDKAAFRREIDRERARIGNTAFNKSEPAERNRPESNGKNHSAHDWDAPDESVLDDRRGELPSFPIDAMPTRKSSPYVRMAPASVSIMSRCRYSRLHPG